MKSYTCTAGKLGQKPCDVRQCEWSWKVLLPQRCGGGWRSVQAHPSGKCRVSAGLQTLIPPSPGPAHGAGHPWMLKVPQLQFNEERWGKERRRMEEEA